MRTFSLIMRFTEELGRILVEGWRRFVKAEMYFYLFLLILVTNG